MTEATTTTNLLALEITDEMAREYYRAVTGVRCPSEVLLDRAKHQLEVARDMLSTWPAGGMNR